MEKIPLFPKILLNFVLYLLYVLFISIGFSFLFPSILLMLWKPIPEPSDPIFYKVQIAIWVVVFVITIIFRRYIYISLHHRVNPSIAQKTVEEKENKKKNLVWNKLKKIVPTKKSQKIDDLHSSEIKIYIDKEIQ